MYLLPKPQRMEIRNGIFFLHYDDKIVLDCSCKPVVYQYAKILQEEIKHTLGYELSITKGQSKKVGIWISTKDTLKEEEYHLEVTAENIQMIGGSEKGILYGIQTLRQIFKQCGAAIPELSISDFPEMKNRGFYYDITRGRIPTQKYFKQLVDTMSFYKLNQLQLYIEHSFLFENLSEVWRDDTPLTAQEILELDQYCSDRGIELIPSIASFGHLYKLLRTKTFCHLCEMPNSSEKEFGFVDRMEHYTIDASNPESIAFIKSLIEEYLPLFRSRYFNIGADETFDLGKGKSKKRADEIGVKQLYLDYVRELCEFLVQKGRIPMFWGDIVCHFPEAVKELPPQTICLNWGYEKDQKEDAIRALAQAKARQYCCPGVRGWDQFVNQIDESYENIKRMCSYAFAFHAEGILITDWGDCGHINHPDFSVIGLIYGAAFSWNLKQEDFESINRQISKIEFGDSRERLVSVIADISHQWIYKWRNAVNFMEKRESAFSKEQLEGVEEKIKALDQIKKELYQMIIGLETEKRKLIWPYLVAIDGMVLFQKIGVCVSAFENQTEFVIKVEPKQLAGELEEWFYEYKKVWRTVSRESELYRIQNVIFWYADYLRKMAIKE